MIELCTQAPPQNIGVGTMGAPGAGAPLDLAILYGERLIEIIAKCVI